MMRRTFAVLLAVLFLAPELPARSDRGWENVEKLRPGTQVEIALWSGEVLSGEIYDVSDVEVQIATADRSGPPVSWLHKVDRKNVRKIVRFREANLPDPRKWMAVGAVAGGAAGLTVGAVRDVRGGTNYNWFLDGLAGAVLGFAASAPVLLVVGVVDIARGPHHRTVVYEDKGKRPSNGGHERPAPSSARSVALVR